MKKERENNKKTIWENQEKFSWMGFWSVSMKSQQLWHLVG
jgi:hypothetical protein